LVRAIVRFNTCAWCGRPDGECRADCIMFDGEPDIYNTPDADDTQLGWADDAEIARITGEPRQP
jgi:hypothetical protein